MLHWYAIYSKPRMEYHVCQVLTERGIESYLPTIEVHAKGRPTGRREICFPRYLFAHLDLLAVPRSSIVWMPGVQQLVSFEGEPAIVDDRLIDLLKRRLAEQEAAGFDPRDRFQPGDLVLIKDGPFRDLQAVFEGKLSARGRVRVLVNILGRMTTCEVSERSLERIG